MPASKVDIWNMAIRHLGESLEIGAENENTKQARACRRFWDACVEKVLSEAPWPFATAYEVLQAVTNPVPSSEFRFAYRYPVNAVRLRRILNGVSRREDMQSRVPFKIVRDAVGAVILCDMPSSADYQLTAEYTYRETATGRFSADFAIALSYLLAREIGPSIASDKKRLIDDASARYELDIRKARVLAFNEEARDEDPESEFQRARSV